MFQWCVIAFHTLDEMLNIIFSELVNDDEGNDFRFDKEQV